MQAVYPQRCAFLLDEQFSAPFKTTLQTYVNQKYQSCKNIKQILQDVSGQFNEIESMDAYVCKTDHLCFSFDAYKPLFLLNDKVVGDNFQLMSKDHYHHEIVDGLLGIKAFCLQEVAKIAAFVAQTPSEVFKEFDLNWLNHDEIQLSQKDKKSDMLIFSATKVPTLDDILLFKKIQTATKNRKKQIYDFRFKDQIVVK